MSMVEKELTYIMAPSVLFAEGKKKIRSSRLWQLFNGLIFCNRFHFIQRRSGHFQRILAIIILIEDFF